MHIIISDTYVHLSSEVDYRFPARREFNAVVERESRVLHICSVDFSALTVLGGSIRRFS